jgi:small subunit ribosomal protein S17
VDSQHHRKELIGIVTSNKMQKTIVVSVERRKKHPIYSKIIRTTKVVKAHDEKNEAQIGDQVRLEECRPLSRDKRWRLVTIVGHSMKPKPTDVAIVEGIES